MRLDAMVVPPGGPIDSDSCMGTFRLADNPVPADGSF